MGSTTCCRGWRADRPALVHLPRRLRTRRLADQLGAGHTTELRPQRLAGRADSAVRLAARIPLGRCAIASPSTRCRRPGGLSARLGARRLWARTPGPRSSVHAYSPPLTAMSYYEVGRRGTLRRTRTDSPTDRRASDAESHRPRAGSRQSQLQQRLPGQQVPAALTAAPSWSTSAQRLSARPRRGARRPGDRDATCWSGAATRPATRAARRR